MSDLLLLRDFLQPLQQNMLDFPFLSRGTGESSSAAANCSGVLASTGLNLGIEEMIGRTTMYQI
jgi:hypothetical protein